MAEGDCRFGVLGPLLFERDGEAVRLPSGRQRSLLALLLAADGAPLARDRLVDELWGERPPPSAVSALHVHLSKLRPLLGDLIVLESGGYALRRGGFALDVTELEQLVEEARQQPQRARTLLSQALSLFRGDPLADVEWEGSLARWQRTLEARRLQVVMLKLDAELADGMAAELVPELERLVAEHPFDEHLWRQLMLALYRAGRQADALEAHARVRQLFARELGLEPGDPLVRLQRQMLEHDPALLLTAAPAERARPQPSRSSLPSYLTRLVGREGELASLAAFMADPAVRLLTLTGTGGVGKTRLLIELAKRQEAAFANGAVLARLERVSDPALVAAEIATAIAVRDGLDGLSADVLLDHLRHRELLLVLDNFEHLLPAATVVAELLALAPSVRVLVSSRIALRVRGEHVFDVRPLPLPADTTADAATASPAVQLFMQCAVAADRRPSSELPAVDAVATICCAVDGLPLGIELAAARSRLLTAGQIAQQLAQPLQIGQYALRDLPSRQQTLQATIHWSYDLLSPSAQELLRIAGAFVGGFTGDALEQAAGRPAEMDLDELLECNLVRRQADEGRFGLLGLVRAFALGELDAHGEAVEVRERHRRYFAALVAPVHAALDDGGLPGELAAPLLADHANLRSALEDAIEARDLDSALALALGLRALWFAGMLRQEAHELGERLLERFEMPGPDELKLLRAIAFVEGSTPTAASLHQRVAARAGEIGDWTSVCTATCNLFGMAVNTRDIAAMRRLRPRLVDLIRPETNVKALGWIHLHLSTSAFVDGELDQALEHASSSADCAHEIGHEYLLATALQIRLMALWARDGLLAQPVLVEALERIRRTGVQTDTVVALWLVARYAAAVAPETAGLWLAHAQRILDELHSEIWPESILREETMAVLGLDDLSPLLAATPRVDHAVALAEAAAWLGTREPGEQASAELRLLAQPV